MDAYDMPQPQGIEPIVGFMLLPVLASTGSGISEWFILWFRDQLSVHHLQSNQDLSDFLSPPGFEPWLLMTSTVSDLKGQTNEILDPLFSHNSNQPGPLTNGLKYFRI